MIMIGSIYLIVFPKEKCSLVPIMKYYELFKINLSLDV